MLKGFAKIVDSNKVIMNFVYKNCLTSEKYFEGFIGLITDTNGILFTLSDILI